jgi:predicted membrane channel-forming protein YqfA (hemolysin III family)
VVPVSTRAVFGILVLLFGAIFFYVALRVLSFPETVGPIGTTNWPGLEILAFGVFGASAFCAFVVIYVWNRFDDSHDELSDETVA